MVNGADSYLIAREAIATTFASTVDRARLQRLEAENAPVRTDTLVIDASTVIIIQFLI